MILREDPHTFYNECTLKPSPDLIHLCKKKKKKEVTGMAFTARYRPEEDKFETVSLPNDVFDRRQLHCKVRKPMTLCLHPNFHQRHNKTVLLLIAVSQRAWPMTISSPNPLYAPLPSSLPTSPVHRLIATLNAKYSLEPPLANYEELYAFSTTRIADFWGTVWDEVGIIGDKGVSSDGEWHVVDEGRTPADKPGVV